MVYIYVVTLILASSLQAMDTRNPNIMKHTGAGTSAGAGAKKTPEATRKAGHPIPEPEARFTPLQQEYFDALYKHYILPAQTILKDKEQLKAYWVPVKEKIAYLEKQTDLVRINEEVEDSLGLPTVREIPQSRLTYALDLLRSLFGASFHEKNLDACLTQAEEAITDIQEKDFFKNRLANCTDQEITMFLEADPPVIYKHLPYLAGCTYDPLGVTLFQTHIKIAHLILDSLTTCAPATGEEITESDRSSYYRSLPVGQKLMSQSDREALKKKAGELNNLIGIIKEDRTCEQIESRPEIQKAFADQPRLPVPEPDSTSDSERESVADVSPALTTTPQTNHAPDRDSIGHPQVPAHLDREPKQTGDPQGQPSIQAHAEREPDKKPLSFTYKALQTAGIAGLVGALYAWNNARSKANKLAQQERAAEIALLDLIERAHLSDQINKNQSLHNQLVTLADTHRDSRHLSHLIAQIKRYNTLHSRAHAARRARRNWLAGIGLAGVGNAALVYNRTRI